MSWFFWGSAALGLFIGLLEAKLLWTSPRVLPLLYPDVRYVIWFLAPLVDMIFFGLVGLILGWIAGRTRDVRAVIAVDGAVAATFVAMTVHWFHLESGFQAFSLRGDLLIPLACFVFAFVACLMILRLVWNRVAGYLEQRAYILLKPLERGLLVTAVIAIAGVGIFATRISFPGASIAVASSSLAGSPNVILITLDTMRADHLSAYGYSRPTTPHLDRFAREGVLFENAISPTSWTLAAHASIFTGLLPHQDGADWAVPMPPGPWTLAEILHSRGYETAGFTANLYCEKGWGIARGFETYEDSSDSLPHNLAQTFVGEAVVQPLYQNLRRYDSFDRRNARQLNANIFRWFRHRSKRPFFLFINYFDTHDPYLTSGSYEHRFGDAPASLLRRVQMAAGRTDVPQRLTASERASEVTAYDNCVAFLDEHVGRLLQFIRQSPEGQNTVVIITGDHGEAFGEHGYYGHGYDLYREELRVPLMIAGPQIPQGSRIQQPVSTRELFSTVLDLAEGKGTPFSRTSLARYWSPGFTPLPFDNAVISELDFPWFWEHRVAATISLTTSEWQYIYDSTGRQQVYHWTVDPEEKIDLSASAREQETLQNLDDRLVEMVRDSYRPWRGPNYLIPLGTGGLFLRGVMFAQPSQSGRAASPLHVGSEQAYFSSSHSWAPSKPSPSEQDLMRSLPYH